MKNNNVSQLHNQSNSASKEPRLETAMKTGLGVENRSIPHFFREHVGHGKQKRTK